MKLYVIPAGSPAVVVYKTLSMNSCASFLLEHAMVFEEQEYVTSDEVEYVFKRDGKEYYFPVSGIKTVT